MGLGLSSSSTGGDFLPLLQYDARAGRLFKIVRDGAGDKQKVDITQDQPQFAVDFLSIEVGWAKFTAGMAPDWRMAPFGKPMPERPDMMVTLNGKQRPAYNQCIRVKVAGKSMDGVREFSASSKAVLGAIDQLHTAYEAAPEARKGMIPVVKLVKTIAVTTTGGGQSSTNYTPVFEIVSWVDRHPMLGEATVAPPGGKIASEAPAPEPELVDEIPF